MLAKFWRLHFINKTGQTMTYDGAARIAIRSQPWKMVSGDLVYGTVITEDMSFESGENIINLGEESGTVVDNSTDLYWGINGTFEITHDLDAADGYVNLYLEFSDNNGNWPSNANDFQLDEDAILISSLRIDNTGVDRSKSKNFAFGL